MKGEEDGEGGRGLAGGERYQARELLGEESGALPGGLGGISRGK